MRTYASLLNSLLLKDTSSYHASSGTRGANESETDLRTPAATIKLSCDFPKNPLRADYGSLDRSFRQFPDLQEDVANLQSS